MNFVLIKEEPKNSDYILGVDEVFNDVLGGVSRQALPPLSNIIQTPLRPANDSFLGHAIKLPWYMRWWPIKYFFIKKI